MGLGGGAVLLRETRWPSATTAIASASARKRATLRSGQTATEIVTRETPTHECVTIATWNGAD